MRHWRKCWLAENGLIFRFYKIGGKIRLFESTPEQA